MALVATYGISMAMVSNEFNTVDVQQSTIVAEVDDVNKEEPKKEATTKAEAKAAKSDGCATAKADGCSSSKTQASTTAKADGCATAKSEGCSSKKTASAEKVAENK